MLGLVMVLLFISCGNDDSDIVMDEDEDTVDMNTENELVQESFFNGSSLVSFEKVTCTLEDGSTGDCYELTFSSNPVASGPFCPETIEDVGGLGIYDGDTNPGFQVLKVDLFNAMEADGFDIIDDATGEIRIDDFNSGQLSQEFNYCLDAAPDNDLELSFLIPAVPTLASTNNNIETIELVGVSIDGVPINGTPPSVVNGIGMVGSAGNIPSLDPCGGHHDPSGYYHWHFVAETMNQVLEEFGIDDVSCTLVEQVSGTKLIGFAKDGFPIYAYEEIPDDLDDCGGRTASTTDFSDGVYHYVASNTDAPNVPKCLKGIAANNNFRFQ